MKRLATVISRIFDPFLVMAAVAVVAIRRSTLSDAGQLRFFIAALVMMLGVPATLLALSVKRKWLSNWDVTVRGERPKALFILFVIEIISILVLQRFADTFLFIFMLFVLGWIIGFFCITLFWKISAHSGIAALGSGLVVAWFGWNWWPVLLIAPLLGWSRVVRRDHTVAQVFAGALYSWAIIYLYSFIK